MANRILLVDDSVPLLESYRDALQEEGYEVVTASSGEEALKCIQLARPDLILTDIFMPGMDGLELITRVRSDVPAPPIPVIAVSGMDAARDEALRRGALAFATKPLDLDGLLTLVSEGLAGHSDANAAREISGRNHRRVARELGEAAVVMYIDREPEALAHLRQSLHTIGRFFGDVRVLLIWSRDGNLESAEADQALPPAAREVAKSVIESASSLVASVRNGSPLRALYGDDVQFLVGVPVMLGPIPIGAIVLMDRAPRPFSGAELGLLEFVASRAASIVAQPTATRVVDHGGFVRPDTFMVALEQMMSLSASGGHPIGVAVARFRLPVDLRVAQQIMADLPSRALVGRRGRQGMNAFALGTTAAEVRERLVALRRRADAAAPIDGWSQLLLEQPLPPVTARTLIDWCAQAALAHEARSLTAIEATHVDVGQ